MKRDLRVLAAAGALSLALTAADAAFAQKTGGILKVGHFDSPASMSMHEESTAAVNRPMMGVFNNLVIYKQDVTQNSMRSIVPDLATSWAWNEEGTELTFPLRQGVKWHDGKPFTADDVVFNWEYARDPATATVTIGVHRDITVEKVDDLTVRILFKKPTPFWADAFVGAPGSIIPKHLFAEYKGAKSREAPNNLAPVGTGPYKFLEFKPGDVIRGELNPDYHMPNRPHFDTIEMKGGGDAVSAARAVIQTGEYDFGWNIQVEDEVLLRLEKGGKGKTVYAVGGDTEFIALNFTDPSI